jgi:nucleoside-triphosphatase
MLAADNDALNGGAASGRDVAGLNLLVTGKPGVGKTTLAARVVKELRPRLRLAGFTTGELRDPAGQRIGFRITALDGREGELARAGLPGRVRVGRYGVNLKAFEQLALPQLARRDVDLLVVDEIGKMECASGRFRRAVEDALDSPVSVLATLGLGHLPFFQALRERPDVELLTLTAGNRKILAPDISLRFLPGG